MAFDPIQYIASYQDLIGAFGANAAAGLQHYNQFGQFEGRQQDLFDERQYLANYRDLQLAFGNNANAATTHYINFGLREGRTDDQPLPTGFNGLQYIASHDDLIDALGADPAAGASHYTQFGRAEGREIDDFNEQQYLANYPDLANAFGGNGGAATLHYILFGQDEGRNDDVPGNNPPVAADDAFDIAANGDRTSLNVLRNDSDPDASDSLTVVAVDDSKSLGSVELTGNGRVFYDPDGSFADLPVGETASDTFSYTIADSAGARRTAEVTITVQGTAEPPPSNNPPTAANDGFEVAANAEAASLDVLANDSDPDPSDPIAVSAVDNTGTIGSVELNAEGGVVYDPSGAFDDLLVGEIATDKFSYTIKDALGEQSTAEVTVTIQGTTEPPVNGAPTFTSADTATVTENTTSVVSLLATDPDGNTVVFEISGGADQGLFAIDAVNQLQFQSPPDFELPGDADGDNIYLVDVTANDGVGGTATQSIAVTVTDLEEDALVTTDIATVDFLL